MDLMPPISAVPISQGAALWTPGTGVLIGPGAFMSVPMTDADAMRSTPAFVAQTPVNINGTPGWRLLSAFRTSGCEVKRQGKGCAMCGFDGHADPYVGDEHIKRQCETVAAYLRQGGFAQADLLTLGNFFNDGEFSPQLRDHILHRMSELPALRRIVVESRREYVTVEKLRLARLCLREDQSLVYSFGYETQDTRIRNDVLGKNVPESYLGECLDMCRESGVDFSAFVMIKPPGLAEEDAIEEAVRTAIHVLQLSAERAVRAHISFEVAFVPKGAGIERLFIEGSYRAPWLWSVAEVVIISADRLGINDTGGRFFVGMSDEGLAAGRVASNCGECDAMVHGAIQIFNGDQDVAPLRSLAHGCKEEWRQALLK